MFTLRQIQNLARPAALTLLLGLVLGPGASVTHAAGADYLLEIDGVPGESEIADLEIKPFGQTVLIGLLLPAIQKVREAASRPNFPQLVCDGTLLPRVTIEVVDAGRRPYLRYELTNVVVTDYAVKGDSQGRPHEEMALNFTKIEWDNLETGEHFAVDCTSGRCVCAP